MGRGGAARRGGRGPNVHQNTTLTCQELSIISTLLPESHRFRTHFTHSIYNVPAKFENFWRSNGHESQLGTPLFSHLPAHAHTHNKIIPSTWATSPPYSKHFKTSPSFKEAKSIASHPFDWMPHFMPSFRICRIKLKLSKGNIYNAHASSVQRAYTHVGNYFYHINRFQSSKHSCLLSDKTGLNMA